MFSKCFSYLCSYPLVTHVDFIDGTVRLVCRPQQNERMICHGNKKIQAIKFQPVVAPNELNAMLDGPYEEKKHDIAIVANSVLLIKLNTFSLDQCNQPLFI